MKSVMWVFDNVLVLTYAAMGFLLGLAGLLMAKLIMNGAWASVFILIAFSGFLFVIVIIDRRLGSLFPIGIKEAPGGVEQAKAVKRRKRNGWIGFFSGVAVAIVASVFIPPEQIIGFF